MAKKAANTWIFNVQNEQFMPFPEHTAKLLTKNNPKLWRSMEWFHDNYQEATDEQIEAMKVRGPGVVNVPVAGQTETPPPTKKEEVKEEPQKQAEKPKKITRPSKSSSTKVINDYLVDKGVLAPGEKKPRPELLELLANTK